MRVAIMTAGSRGDVAPYTGLGRALAGAGHDVTLVTHARFAALAGTAGLGFHALPVDPLEQLESSAGRALHRIDSEALKLGRFLLLVRSLAGQLAEGLIDAARAADVLLLSASIAPLGRAVAQALGLPSMGVYLQPLAPTREFAPAALGGRSWGAVGNTLAARAVAVAVNGVFADANRRVRRTLAVDRATRRAVGGGGPWPVFHGFSPTVVPRPADWSDELRVCGYWWQYDPPEQQLPETLRDFLQAGPPPVYVGFGSATVSDAGRLSVTVLRALRTARVRGVVQRGWAGLEVAAEDVLMIDEVPHARLFPQTAAVVHHAGAGTTAAMLRAGVPGVPLPVQFDAAFWAARVTALGVAPRAIPIRRVTAPALAEAIRSAVGDARHAERAAHVAARICAEDGAAPVLAALEQVERLG